MPLAQPSLSLLRGRVLQVYSMALQQLILPGTPQLQEVHYATMCVSRRGPAGTLRTFAKLQYMCLPTGKRSPQTAAQLGVARGILLQQCPAATGSRVSYGWRGCSCCITLRDGWNPEGLLSSCSGARTSAR